MDKIYVIGHKSPDLDSVAAAITYSIYKNQKEKTDKYTPAVAGEINQVTKFVLDKWGFDIPELLSNATEKKLILVDHNEKSQSIDGVGESNIVEILDHHKLNFSYKDPIRVNIWPLGSSNSIIYKKYKNAKLPVEKNLAGLMLSALLDDTVITKSPTCTSEDKFLIQELSGIAEISDWYEYGIEMFKEKANVADKSTLEVIKLDYKDFEMKQGKFGIGQVETVDLEEFKTREAELLQGLKELQTSEGYHTCILFMTDILKEGSLFLVASKESEKIAKAFNAKLEEGKVYIEGIISRKKQVAPKIMEVFDK